MTTTAKDQEAKPKKTKFLVLHRLVWKGRVCEKDTYIDVRDAEMRSSQIRGWVLRKWVRSLTEEEIKALPAEPPVKSKIVATPMAAGSPVVQAADRAMQVRMVPLADIRPDVTQPRKHFEPSALAELVESIRTHGVEQAILVRPRNPDGGPVQDGSRFGWYEIVYGERRWRAAKEAGLTEIPAKVRELTDIEAAEKQGIENLERADLLPLEVAAQYRKLLDLPGYGMERLMQVTGHAKNTIYGKLKLLDLPEEAQSAVQRGELPVVTAERIARLDVNVQQKAMKAILHPERWQQADGKVLSDRQAKEAIEQAAKEVAKERKIQALKDTAIARGISWIDEDSKRYKEICGNYGYEPQAKSGYVLLEQRVPGDGQYRTYGDILKLKTVAKHAKALKPKAATTRYGELREFYDLAEVRAVFKAANWTVPKQKREVDPHEAKRRAKDKLMNAVLDRAAGAIRLRSQLFCPRVAQTPDMLGMWKALARCAVNLQKYRLDEFVRRRGLEPVMAKTGSRNVPDYEKTVLQYLVNKSASDLAGIVAELLLTHEAWNRYLGDDFQEAFRIGAGEFGVDLAQIKDELGAGTANAEADGQGDDDESAGARTEEEAEDLEPVEAAA